MNKLRCVLRLTAVAGVVHGALTLDAVRWNGERLQLVDFESAELAGERRRNGRASAARSPEQAAGAGVADARDDLWGAAQLIRALHLGGSAPPERTQDPERLRVLLDPVFDNPLERRPHAEELLRALRAETRVPPSVDPDAPFAPGRALFEQVSQGKRKPAARATMAVPVPAKKPDRRARWMFSVLAAMILLAIAAVGAMVLL